MCSCENHTVQKQLVFRMNCSYLFKACFLPIIFLTSDRFNFTGGSGDAAPLRDLAGGGDGDGGGDGEGDRDLVRLAWASWIVLTWYLRLCDWV